MTRISLVYAQSKNGIIGSKGGLPWHLPSDLKRFKAVTMGKPIIMGRKTWESLPRKPLPGRQNVILTRQTDFVAEGAHVVSNVTDALDMVRNAEEVCVIGGAEIYQLFLPMADRVYLTKIDMVVEGDAHAPNLESASWQETLREHHPAGPADDANFTFHILDKISD